MSICHYTGACVRILEYGTYMVCDIHRMDPKAPDEQVVYILYAIHQPFLEAPREVTHEVEIGWGWYKNHTGKEVTIVCREVDLVQIV